MLCYESYEARGLLCFPHITNICCGCMFKCRNSSGPSPVAACVASCIAAAAPQVQVLRNYLGTALIHAYELRHLTLRRLLVSSTAGAAGSSTGLLDLDAELYLQAYCRSVMLEWVDALWSCFLEVGG
jgi:hypothetical protein